MGKGLGHHPKGANTIKRALIQPRPVRRLVFSDPTDLPPDLPRRDKSYSQRPYHPTPCPPSPCYCCRRCYCCLRPLFCMQGVLRVWVHAMTIHGKALGIHTPTGGQRNPTRTLQFRPVRRRVFSDSIALPPDLPQRGKSYSQHPYHPMPSPSRLLLLPQLLLMVAATLVLARGAMRVWALGHGHP